MHSSTHLLLKPLNRGLLSLLLTSRASLGEFKGLVRRLRWWRLLFIACALAQLAILVCGAWWGVQAHRLLGSFGVNGQDLQDLMTAEDPANEAATFIRRHPQLLGMARSAVQAAVGENGRVVVLPETNRVILDVSAKQTFRFLFGHILANHGAEMLSGRRGGGFEATDTMYVVDLGAFDGLIASNSYNFLELGWRGLLVEPTPNTFRVLRKTVDKFADRVALENVAVGDESKVVSFYTYDNPTSNSMYDRDPQYAKSRSKVTVQMWKASALLNKHNVPHAFGVLSIDVEGLDQEVMHDILNAGYRPLYIIVEIVTLGLKESNTVELQETMQRWGYSMISKLHLNFIFHANSQ